MIGRLVAVLPLLAAGCAGSPPASFETLGVPDAEAPPGGGAVILGWETEARGGWAVRSVSVDGRRARRWDAESQRPVVLRVRAGERRLRITATGPSGAAARGRARRYRPRPVTLEVAEGDVHLCVVRLSGRGGRSRPRLRCSPRSRGGTPPAEAEEDRDALVRRIVALELLVAELRPLLAPEGGATDAGPAMGTLEVAVAPGLLVSVDGGPASPAGASAKVAAGRHHVKVTGEGVQPFEAVVTVEPHERVVLAPILTKLAAPEEVAAEHGYLNLSSTPWAEVYEGGNKLGTTPLVKAKLPVGLRRLRLVPEGHGRGWTIAVTISPEQTTRCFASEGAEWSGTCSTVGP